MYRNYVAFFACVALLLSCGRFKNKEVDGTKKMRLVSLSKHLTEYTYALGKGHNLVACDLSSTYPDSAKLLKTVGYHRALSAEAIIGTEPDLVIHSNDIGPEAVVLQLEKAGIHTKVFGGASTIDSALLLMTALGKFYGEEAKATELNHQLDIDLAKAATALQQITIKDTPKVMIIHFGRANNIYFVMSGRKGVGDKMIQLAGAKVAGYDGKGARQLSAEAVAAANPDIIIATDFGFDQMGDMDKFIAGVPGVALTNAGKNKRIIRFEEHDLVYFGPRTGANLIKLMHEIHKP